MITRVQSTPIVLGSSGNGIATMSMDTADGNNISLYAADSTQSNLKPPDYHLPFTGDQVVEALWKIINLKLEEVGGITKVESTEDAPFNMDTATTPGNYIVNYITGATVPEEFKNMQPINVNVVYKTDPETGETTIIQVVECGGNKYYRWSKDNGVTWSEFAPKSTNSGEIDTTVDPTEPPPKDPVTVLEEKQTATEEEIKEMKVKLANSLRLGTVETGTAIMNGTFDYDTVFAEETA